MKSLSTKMVEESLAKPDIHRQWRDEYLIEENERFFNLAFDYVVRELNAPRDATILDAGCGICLHARRLAACGFNVVAVDFSESILREAEEAVRAAGLSRKITLRREDLLSLSFRDGSFDYIVCWGVLMHIPDVETALSELARVLRPGGLLVVSEGNMHSFQAKLRRDRCSIKGMQCLGVKRTPAGMEYWASSPAGMILTRHADMEWLIEKGRSNLLYVRSHVAGQFTDLYTRTPSRLSRKLIHLFNNFWFAHIRFPRLAFGNIVLFEKEV